MWKTMNPQIKEIAKSIVDYLKTLPDGTEISTSEAYKHLFKKDIHYLEDQYGFESMFQLNSEVRRLASRKRLKLDDSGYDDMETGLLFNIPYIVTRKR